MTADPRHRLGPLLGYSYANIAAAALLLEHKAAHSPASAEAQAHALLIQAQRDIEQWTADAAELLGETLAAGQGKGAFDGA